MATRVLRDFRVQIKAKMASKVEAALGTAADNVVATAKALVPVRTGALQASIVSEKVGPLKHRVTAGGGDVNYPGYVELGTSTQAAQPYMIPAVEQAIPELVSDLKK